MSKLECCNCGKKGHFACDYKEPKKVNDLYELVSVINVYSFVYLTESYYLWTVDSRATNYVAKGKSSFLEFRWVQKGTRWIYVGNNSRVEVKRIGMCKLVMRSGKPYSYMICYLLLTFVEI